MDDHGDEDERAAAALEALRRGGGPGSAGSSASGGALLAEVLETVRRLPGRTVVLVGVALLAAAALALVALRPAGAPEPADADLFSEPATVDTVATGPTSSTTTPAVIVVHAAGAVATPGVYGLPDGSRVADLVERAGGTLPDADLDRVNLAAVLADGQRVYVPRHGEGVPPAVAPQAGGGSGGTGDADGTGAAPGPLDLNSASAEQLDELPGIGPATAAAIVEHRARNGPFASVDSLLDVRGIGPAKLEALRDLVTVG